MYDTSGSYSVCYAAPPDDNVTRRLSWLKVELASQEASEKMPRRVAEEWRLLRSNPLGTSLTTEEAYAWFGTFLGLFPTFALFARIYRAALLEGITGHLPAADGFVFWALLFLVMNAICCLVGRKFGALLGRKLGDPRAWRWPVFVFSSLMMAVAWGVVTGAAGGAIVFLIGALAGVFCAVPVALAAFPVFAVLHRALSRGGMIEERRLWPLAFGVPLTIAALILGPGMR
ncbi:MAG: hypothetical protein QOH51_2755 [Acidobacteriota bacterium]|nr:hypothetical protein [Acidobacteriota bacterium]